MPISGKPEIGGAPRNDELRVFQQPASAADLKFLHHLLQEAGH
jgi:hypothetical protein